MLTAAANCFAAFININYIANWIIFSKCYCNKNSLRCRTLRMQKNTPFAIPLPAAPFRIFSFSYEQPILSLCAQFFKISLTFFKCDKQIQRFAFIDQHIKCWRRKNHKKNKPCATGKSYECLNDILISCNAILIQPIFVTLETWRWNLSLIWLTFTLHTRAAWRMTAADFKYTPQIKAQIRKV